MWEVASCLIKNQKLVNEFLAMGYEPFTVTSDYGYDRLWLKKKVDKDAVCDKPTGRKQGKSTRSSV